MKEKKKKKKEHVIITNKTELKSVIELEICIWRFGIQMITYAYYQHKVR